MKKFLKSIFLFAILALIVGEAVVRITHTMSDIPQRTIDNSGIQKYYPNQEGYWRGGKHKWMINEMGWPGELPNSLNNLVIVIGDSYIENFMNPNECHQAVYLKGTMKNYNFMEASRSGVSLIEAMEISKQLDSLQPKQTLFYVNNNDFFESIVEVKPMRDITQLSLESSNIVYGKMKAPTAKKILYNWKLLYYFYTKFPLNLPSEEAENPIKREEVDNTKLESKQEVFDLLEYIINNYNIGDKTLVFHPNSNQVIIEQCKQLGFNVITLDSSKDKNWSFEYDSHWTCYGHKRAAEQVANSLKTIILPY